MQSHFYFRSILFTPETLVDSNVDIPTNAAGMFPIQFVGILLVQD